MIFMLVLSIVPYFYPLFVWPLAKLISVRAFNVILS